MKFLFLIVALVASCRGLPVNVGTFDLPAEDAMSLPLVISPMIVAPLAPVQPIVSVPLPLEVVDTPQSLPLAIEPLPMVPLPGVIGPEGPSTFPLIPEEAAPAQAGRPLIQIILNIASSSDVAVDSPLLPWTGDKTDLTRPWLEEPVVEETDKSSLTKPWIDNSELTKPWVEEPVVEETDKSSLVKPWIDNSELTKPWVEEPVVEEADKSSLTRPWIDNSELTKPWVEEPLVEEVDNSELTRPWVEEPLVEEVDNSELIRPWIEEPAAGKSARPATAIIR